MDNEESRPYRVKVTVRNNLLLSAIEQAGFKSQAEFARSSGVNIMTLNALVGLRDAPIGKRGEFTDAAKQIMEALGAAPSDLWSEEQLTMNLRRNTGEKAISFSAVQDLLEEHQDAMMLPSPESMAMELDAKNVIESALNSLTPREAHVVRMHNQENMTYDEIAKVEGVSIERIRQIEAKAFRKLRHESRSAALKELL